MPRSLTVEHCLKAIRSLDREIAAWAHVDQDAALQVPTSGPLAGVPIGIKDIIDVADMPTCAGAAAFAHEMADDDAEVVRRLKAAGAVILGKTATTEFAYLAPAATRNPWNLDHTPGGSSSGSAAAVASGMVQLALGSQTVGSILRPAAYCGVIGFKPSYQSISTQGVRPVSESLDNIGAFARNVHELRELFQVLAPDAKVSEANSTQPRIAVVRGFAEERLARFYQQVESLKEGPLSEMHFEELDIGSRERWFGPGIVVLSAEAARHHATSFAAHKSEYRRETAELMEQGLAQRATDYIEAKESLAGLRRETIAMMSGFDALLMPSAPGTAPKRLSSTGDSTFCAPATFAGLPSISLPSGMGDDELPLAIQLVGAEAGDHALLNLAATVEARLQFTARPKHSA